MKRKLLRDGDFQNPDQEDPAIEPVHHLLLSAFAAYRCLATCLLQPHAPAA